MEKKMSETPDGTMNTLNVDLNNGPKRVLDYDDTPMAGDELGSYHLNKKAKVMHNSNILAGPSSDHQSNNDHSSDSNMLMSTIYSRDSMILADLEEHDKSNENNRSVDSFVLKNTKYLLDTKILADLEHHHKNNDNNYDFFSKMVDSSIHSKNSMAANSLQSSRSHMSLEAIFAQSQTASPQEDHLAKLGYEASDHEGIFHSKYRNPGPNLITVHIFTGKMNGTKPVYVPVYKRNKAGRLLKLTKGGSGDWYYHKVEELSEDEADAGMKLREKPKVEEVVVQSSEPGKAPGRRTLADFSFPETEAKGGWGWL